MDQIIECGNDSLLLCGLHTCGNLGVDILKLFLTSQKAQLLCYVSCCYHLINGNEAFPLSKLLCNRNYTLSRNARMLAAQSLERNSKSSPSKGIFYRSLLQIILDDHGISYNYLSNNNENVGKIAPKCADFKEYVRKALTKLDVNIDISDSVIDNYYSMYSHCEAKVNAFQYLRTLIAPCIEALLLMDRLVFLLEQPEIQDAYLMQIFDPLKSPRCIALIAKKNHYTH